MSIIVNETDNTLYGTRVADTDNIVFVPGSAITGTSEPTLYTSYNDFVSNHGDHGVEGSLTWDYVANILLAGFPVLFKRITHETGEEGAELVTHAKLDVKNTADTDIILTFTDLYGGSYGNSLNIELKKEYESVYLRIKRDQRVIETYKIATITDEIEEDDAKVKELVIKGLNSVKSNRISISIPDEEKFEFIEISNKYLTGGKDADETKILEVISEENYNNSLYPEFEDLYLYNIKFICSGGYVDSDLTIANNLVKLAEARGDCVAFLDMPMGIEKGIANTYFNTINTSYAAAFAPWCYCELSTKTQKWMPPSFVFLNRLARSIITNNNPIWYPVAGVKRASLSNVLNTEYDIGATMLEEWTGDSSTQALNPIMKLRSYGYVIYGQRTLYASDDSNYPSPSALRQLGIRLTVNEVKRAIFDIAIGLKFEKNDLYTWNEFRTLLNPLLTAMKSDRGISDYQILMNKETTTDEDIQEFRIRGKVSIAVLNPVEDFEIDFVLEPQSVTFENEDIIA